jgi:uncharacterized membrane protein
LDKMQIWLRSFSALSVLALVLLPGLQKDAHGGEWSVCNRTPDELEIAIGYANSTGGIVTKGWWKLRGCGGCARVLNQNETADYTTTYLHAHANGRGIIEGNENFCVQNNAFTLDNAQGRNCGEKKSFRNENVNLNKDWTTNITGRGLSGGACID